MPEALSVAENETEAEAETETEAETEAEAEAETALLCHVLLLSKCLFLFQSFWRGV